MLRLLRFRKQRSESPVCDHCPEYDQFKYLTGKNSPDTFTFYQHHTYIFTYRDIRGELGRWDVASHGHRPHFGWTTPKPKGKTRCKTGYFYVSLRMSCKRIYTMETYSFRLCISKQTKIMLTNIKGLYPGVLNGLQNMQRSALDGSLTN